MCHLPHCTTAGSLRPRTSPGVLADTLLSLNAPDGARTYVHAEAFTTSRLVCSTVLPAPGQRPPRLCGPGWKSAWSGCAGRTPYGRPTGGYAIPPAHPHHTGQPAPRPLPPDGPTPHAPRRAPAHPTSARRSRRRDFPINHHLPTRQPRPCGRVFPRGWRKVPPAGRLPPAHPLPVFLLCHRVPQARAPGQHQVMRHLDRALTDPQIQQRRIQRRHRR